MRIGLFTDAYPPFINGVSTSVNMLKNALEKEGHEVFVVTVNIEKHKFKLEEDGKVIRAAGIPIKLYDFRIASFYPLKATKIIKKLNLDIIHSHTEFGIGIYARILSKKLKIPVVHTYHTMYEDYKYYITKGHFDKLSSKLLKHLTKYYCDKTAKELIVPTKKTKDFLIEKYNCNENIHVIPTGIEIEKFYCENVKKEDIEKVRKKLKLNKDDFNIIFVGRIAEEKNILFLIKAQEKLKNENIKLIIVGTGPQVDFLKDKAKELGIEDKVIFTGKVNWQDIPAYYQVADVFATASTTETQGLTVIEAMSAGKIPLCINDESFLKTVKNKRNGIIFNNEEEYCNEVLKLYKNKDKEYFKNLKNNARSDVMIYSAENYAKSCLKVYEKAIREYPNIKTRKKESKLKEKEKKKWKH